MAFDTTTYVSIMPLSQEDKVRDVLQDLSRDSVATLRMVTELLSKVIVCDGW